MTLKTVALNQLRILYLDDQVRDIKNFNHNINRYNNNNREIGFEPLFAQAVLRVDEALGILEKDDSINVFICDHNMPDKKGLELITQLLKKEYENLLCVLYTGGGNINRPVREACKAENIILFDKAEEFSTLIEQIFDRLPTAPPNYLKLVYDKIAVDIIDDMRRTERIDADFRILIEEKEYTPSQIIMEVNNSSKFGIKYVMTYIDGLKIIKGR